MEAQEEVKVEKVEETPVESATKKEHSNTDKSLVEQFQRIAKQEKYVSGERKKLDEQKKALEADKIAVESYRSLKDKNPFEILEHFGITYDKLLEADKARNSPIDPMTKKALEAVEQLKAEMRNKDEEAEKARIAKAELELNHSIDQEIKEGEYDLIDKLGVKSAIREYMEEMFDATGNVPTIKEACDAVNEGLLLKLESIKDSKWLKQQQEAPKAEVKIPTKQESLSNKMVQTSEVNKRPQTTEERIRAAAALMGG